MEVHRENNLAIYFDYLDDVQIKKLRELKEGRYVVYITETFNHFSSVPFVLFQMTFLSI